MSTRFEHICHAGRCNVCGKETDVVVCCSTMGAISYAYCKECYENMVEPYDAMVSYIACAGRFPDDINETYRGIVRRSLQYLGKTEEQFIADVDHESYLFEEPCDTGFGDTIEEDFPTGGV